MTLSNFCLSIDHKFRFSDVLNVSISLSHNVSFSFINSCICFFKVNSWALLNKIFLVPAPCHICVVKYKNFIITLFNIPPSIPNTSNHPLFLNAKQLLRIAPQIIFYYNFVKLLKPLNSLFTPEVPTERDNFIIDSGSIEPLSDSFVFDIALINEICFKVSFFLFDAPSIEKRNTAILFWTSTQYFLLPQGSP